MPTASRKPPAPPGLNPVVESMRASRNKGKLKFFHDCRCSRGFPTSGRSPSPRPPPALAQSESLKGAERRQQEPEVSLCERLPRDKRSPQDSDPDWKRSEVVPVLCSLIGEDKCQGDEVRPPHMDTPCPAAPPGDDAGVTVEDSAPREPAPAAGRPRPPRALRIPPLKQLVTVGVDAAEEADDHDGPALEPPCAESVMGSGVGSGSSLGGRKSAS
mmetsp:Transcript_53158/g.154784  ORF Transcript_53158/g.154784 Transcript_53158/m.154784 type:complete len:215 (+) Transcript_53158:2-646(+)